MKKLFYFLSCLAIFFSFSLSVNAATSVSGTLATIGKAMNTPFYGVYEQGTYSLYTCSAAKTKDLCYDKDTGDFTCPYSKYCTRKTKNDGVKDFSAIPYTPVSIKVNNEYYKAFCVDPGYHVPAAGAEFTCTKIPNKNINTAAIIYVYNQYKDKTSCKDMGFALLAIRYFSHDIKLYENGNNAMRNAIYNFSLSYDYNSDGSCGQSVYDASRNYNSNPSGDLVAEFKAYINEVKHAVENSYDPNDTAEITSSGKSSNITSSSFGNYKITLTKENVNTAARTITYKAVVNANVDVNFTCTENCRISGLYYDISNNLTMVDISGNAEYAVTRTYHFVVHVESCPKTTYSFTYGLDNPTTASSKSSGNDTLYHCVSKGTDVQSFVIVSSDSTITNSGFNTETGKIPCSECDVIPQDDQYYGAMCCEDSTDAYYREPLIRDLFCDTDTSTVKVTGNVVSSAAKDYEIDPSINTYCTLYCDERINIKIPAGGTTSRNGKYFDFNPAVLNSDGSVYSKGPYFVGYKTCRLITDYKKWQSDYVTATEKAVKSYNDYQEKQTYADSMSKAKSTFDGYSSTRLSSTVGGTATYKGTITRKKDSAGSGCSEEKTETESVTCKFYAKAKPASETLVDGTKNNVYPTYYYDKVTVSYIGGKEINLFNGLSIVDLNSGSKSEFKTGSYSDPSTGKSYYVTSWNESSQAEKDCNASSSIKKEESCTYTCYNCCSCPDYSKTVKGGDFGTKPCDCDKEYKETITLNYKGVSKSLDGVTNTSNFNEKVEAAVEAAGTAKTTFETDSKSVESLKNAIETCNNYFTSGAGSSSSNYSLDISVNFQYHQVYVDNSTSKITVKENDMAFRSTSIPHNAEIGSSSSEDYLKKDLGLNDEQYNKISNSLNEKAKITNFKTSVVCADTSADCSSNTYKTNLNAEISIAQKYVTDAYYKDEVTTTDEDHTFYTLYPYGSVSTTKTTLSVKKDKKYYVEYSALSGKFLTLWDVKGLGTNGKFDKYFEDGNSCSGEDVSDFVNDAGFSCKYTVNSELTKLQGCDSTKVVSSNTYDDYCCTGGNCNYTGGDELAYSFRIVDSSDLFPSNVCSDLNRNSSVTNAQFNSCYSNLNYGYNWLQKDDGHKALNEIQKNGVTDTVYSEDHVTYTIYLKESDLTKIKEYNSNKSYSDFNMTCKCAGGADVSSCTTYLYNCQSDFLYGLYDGKLSGVSGSLSVTGRLSELNTLRGSNEDLKSHVHIAK